MHLRRLIVLITNARNIIGRPRSCNRIALRHRAGFLDQRQRPSVDQKKKPKSRRCPAPPRGCRVKRCKTRSLYDVKISGHGSTRDRHGQTLLSDATYKARKYRNQPALAAGDRRPPRKRQRRIRPREPHPTLPFEPSSHGLLASNRSSGAICPRLARDASKWWSQTGSNRRHPACKAGALPAELWPHLGATNQRMVGPGRLELPTSRLSGVRSNHLSYGPSGLRQKLRCQVRKRTLTRKIRRL